MAGRSPSPQGIPGLGVIARHPSSEEIVEIKVECVCYCFHALKRHPRIPRLDHADHGRTTEAAGRGDLSLGELRLINVVRKKLMDVRIRWKRCGRRT